MTTPTETAPASLVRGCDGCGQTDDHPRHVVSGGSPDGTLVVTARHMDCCASEGCTVCAAQLAGAEHLRGDELRAHLETLPARS